MAYGWNGTFDRQQELLLRWLEFARRCHDPYQLRHIYSHLATVHAFRGQWAQVEEALARSQAIVERLGSPEPLATLQWERGILTSLQGDLGAVEELLRESITAYPSITDSFVHTYSIVVCDPHTSQMGVAVQSHYFSVGSTVPWAEAGVGAVATQAFANIDYGPEGLALMRQGLNAEQALETLLKHDEHDGE